MRYPVCMFNVNPLKIEKTPPCRAFHASARTQKNCGNRLQSCNKYNVSSFALGHKEIARGRAWSLPIHLARRGFSDSNTQTDTKKSTQLAIVMTSLNTSFTIYSSVRGWLIVLWILEKSAILIIFTFSSSKFMGLQHSHINFVPKTILFFYELWTPFSSPR